MKRNKTLLERFEEKYTPEPNTGCWLWLGSTTHDGYGTFSNNKRKGGNELAHRAAYTLFLGPIPKGLQLDHLCRVRCCVNPQHMELVSGRENVSRGLISKLKENKTSKYVGVCWDKHNKCWRADIHILNKNKFIGTFRKEEDAAAAYQKALRELNDKKE